jgi:hypothetical protein
MGQSDPSDRRYFGHYAYFLVRSARAATFYAGTYRLTIHSFSFSFYAHGEEIRRNSKFASRVQAERDAQMGDQNQDEKGNSTHHESAKRRRSRDTEATAVGGDNDGNGNGGGKEGRNPKKTQSPQGMQPAKQRDTPSKRMAYL